MDTAKILKTVDHTLLNQTATWEEIKVILDDAVKYETASVCIPASYVKDAADYLAGRIPVCTVIGFPNGYSTTAVKCFETEDAVKNGAEEIDMVINIGWVKDKKYDAILEEIKAIKKACNGKLLKVIIETCLLTDEEKIKLCKVVSESGAEYIKTSTGFGGGGATFDDVKLFKDNIAPHLKIKAAGGIADLSDAEKFLSLGADRLGTSRVVKAVKNINDNEKGGY
ncbi:MAG: deoxyribose-phosphate aldolase [Firmicutes bacterium]|nr:deoxyribose-phosphate aldolase [Bacillota bacterium]